MTKDEALDLALEALDIVKIHFTQNRHVNEAITAIKQALAAQPAVQKPFCFYYVENGEEYFAPKGAYVPDNAQPLYTTAAQPAVQEPVALEMDGKQLTLGEALDEAIAAPVQQKPYAYANPYDLSANTAFRWCEINEYTMPVYTTPPAQPAPVPLTDEQITDKNRLDWLNNNFFNRENVDWLTGNVSTESLMWVFFAPTKVQGDIRRVIDAAMDRDNGITKGQP
jgi:hypothetical protein